MSVTTHRATAPSAVRCAVVTVSDTRTLDTDTSGRAIADALASAGHAVVRRHLVKDDARAVSAAVRGELTADDVDVIITTGGTGLSSRDTTADTMAAIYEKTIDGFGELFRMLSFHEIGPAAMLSRASAGIAARSVVFVLPGSEPAVRLAMTRLILPELGHLVGELRKKT